MSDNRLDRVTISREAQVSKPSGASPAWLPPVLRPFYEFTKKMAKSFSQELKEEKKEAREAEFIKVVGKTYRGQA